MIVVADASPLIAIDAAVLVDRLLESYGPILIPPAVQAEILAGGEAGSALLARRGIEVREVHDRALVAQLRAGRLGAGESEAIALGIAVQATLILIDDLRARRRAEALGLKPMGVLGILLKAKQGGRLAAIAPAIQAMQDRADFRISATLLKRVLTLTGEAR